MKRFPREFTKRYAKDMLYHAKLHCWFGPSNVPFTRDLTADTQAGNILHDLFAQLCREEN